MPISGYYTWNENEEVIFMKVPLKGVPKKKVDVFVSLNMLKISYSPFLIQLLLFGDVDDKRSRAIYDQGELKLCIHKVRAGIWGELLFDGSDKEKEELRSLAMIAYDIKIRNEIKKAKETNIEEKRKAVRAQMNLEQTERERIDYFKEAEKKEALEKVYKNISPLVNATTKCFRSESGESRHEKHHNASEMVNDFGQQEMLPIDDVETAPLKNPAQVFKEISKVTTERQNSIPAPRTTSKVLFMNTPRLFKTPLRESAETREKKFITRNRPYLHKNKLLNNDTVDISERHPIWLKKKGDDFICNRDYHSAIHAYSSTLEIDNEFVQALGCRAACYLYLEEPERCIRDCMEALQSESTIKIHFSDLDKENRFRKDIHIYIAASYSQLGNLTLTKNHFKLALDLIANTDDSLHQDFRKVSDMLNALNVKKEGDEALRKGSLENALASYSEALQYDTKLISAFSNRSFLFLASGKKKECILDCTSALDLLSKFNNSHKLRNSILKEETKIHELESLHSLEQRVDLITSILCRRAVARVELQEYSEALQDLQVAHHLTSHHGPPSNVEELDKDISTLKGKIQKER